MASGFISVIVPVYNRADLVGEAIGSVIAQTFGDFELIVVDDGSTDGTVERVRAFADDRVRLIRSPGRQGSNAARNLGLAEATGEVVCFLDSDDIYLPGKLEFVARRFREDPSIDVMVDSFVRACSPHARRSFRQIRNPDTGSTDEFAIALFSRELFKATTAISVRRDRALAVGGFDTSVRQRQDFEFLVRLTEVAKCVSTSEIMWIKGWTADRITNRERFFAATIELVERHPQYIGVRAYRRGLARDLARNGYFLIREGKWKGAFADVGRAARAFGPFRAIGLLASGIGQALARSLKHSPEQACDERQFSLIEAEALAAARNRALGRS